VSAFPPSAVLRRAATGASAGCGASVATPGGSVTTPSRHCCTRGIGYVSCNDASVADRVKLGEWVSLPPRDGDSEWRCDRVGDPSDGVTGALSVSRTERLVVGVGGGVIVTVPVSGNEDVSVAVGGGVIVVVTVLVGGGVMVVVTDAANVID